MTHDPYESPIICSGCSGPGADFLAQYHGPREKMPEGCQMTVRITRKPVAQVGICCVCHKPFDRYRQAMVRCRVCQDKRNTELCQKRDAARAKRRKNERKALDTTYKTTIL
jgi:hypothetical protein